MAKSKFDFQQVLLQHGERIGLGLAGGVTALLVGLSLFLPGKGFFSGSPSKMAKDLEEVASRVDQKLRDPNNLPGEADKPPPPGDKLQALNRQLVNAADHQIGPVVTELTGGSLGRRVPKVFPIEEAVAKYKPMRIQSYIFTDDGRIYVFKDGGSGGGVGGGRGPGGGMGGMGGRGGLGGLGGLGGGLMGGGMGGMGGMAGGGRGGLGGLGVPGQLDPTEGERKNRPFDMVPLNQLEKRGVSLGNLAEQVRPVRMALIAAAFPFKKQVEEFRSKLALRSNAEVLSEVAFSSTASKLGPLTAFRFAGARVQRRELDGNGEPVKVKGADGNLVESTWKDLDLNGSFKPYVILTGKRSEPEDPELGGVIWPGLTMNRPMVFRESNLGSGSAGMAGGPGMPGVGGRGAPPPGGGLAGGGGLGSPDGGEGGPPGGRGGLPGPGGGGPRPTKTKTKTESDDDYPPVEKSLDLIKKTIDTIKSKNRPVLAAPPDQFRPGDDFDVFSNNSSPAGVGGPGGMDSPGGMGGMMGGRPGMRGPGRPGSPGMPGGGMGDYSQDLELPEYVLVRLIDVTVEPGKTYEYRLQVRMGNPNHEHPEAASPAYRKEPEIVSDWSQVPIRVHVDPEMHFYAIDQVAVERETNPRYRDTGPHRNHNLTPDQQIYLQAHRWLETVRPRGFSSPLVFGEWTVAERYPAWKGEYVGSEERVEVPVWQFARESFTIASDNTTAKRTPGIGVYFGYAREKNDTKEAILVDFTTGRHGYKRIVSRSEDRSDPLKTVDEVSGVEALVLRPDGRLMLLEGAEDYGDPERKKRVEKVRKRIADTKKPHRASPAGGGPGGGGTGSGDGGTP